MSACKSSPLEHGIRLEECWACWRAETLELAAHKPCSGPGQGGMLKDWQRELRKVCSLRLEDLHPARALQLTSVCVG